MRVVDASLDADGVVAALGTDRQSTRLVALLVRAIVRRRSGSDAWSIVKNDLTPS